MAIIPRKRADGSTAYQVKVKIPGTDDWLTETVYDKLEAESRNVYLKKKARRPGGAMALHDGRITPLKEYFPVWAADRRGNVSEGWKKTQDQMFASYIERTDLRLDKKVGNPELCGNLMMADFTAATISRILNAMQTVVWKTEKDHPAGGFYEKLDKPRAPQTVLHVYNLLNSMFGDAHRFYKMIEENPVSEEFHRPDVPEVVRDFLTPADSWRVLELAKTFARVHPKNPAIRSVFMGRPVWLMFLGGLRYEAIAGGRWCDILWGSDQIRIRRAFKRKEGVMRDYPKGGDQEYVPLIRDLKAYLWAEWQTVLDPMAFICPGPKGGMLNHGTFAKALTALCKAAGVPEISPHECRHSCTEIWMQAGASREDVQRLLNQKSSSSTDRYIHRTDDRLFEVADEVSRRRLRVVEGGRETGFPNCFPNGKPMADHDQVLTQEAAEKAGMH